MPDHDILMALGLLAMMGKPIAGVLIVIWRWSRE